MKYIDIKSGLIPGSTFRPFVLKILARLRLSARVKAPETRFRMQRAIRGSRLLHPFSSSLSLLPATPRITSFSPSLLATTQSSTLHSVGAPSAESHWLLAAVVSSHVFARIRHSRSLTMSLSFSLSLHLSFVRLIVLSPSRGFRRLCCALTRFLYRSCTTPNYPDVTGAARRLFQANSRDFGKFIGPRSRNLQPNERLQGRARVSAYELGTNTTCERSVQLRPASFPTAHLRFTGSLSHFQ